MIRHIQVATDIRPAGNGPWVAGQQRIGRHALRLLLACLVLVPLGGCGLLGHAPPSADRATAGTPVWENPLFVQVANREFLWDQVVDTIDDFFIIQHEERVRLFQGTLIEGRIDTLPRIGSTLLEPWRKDSTPGPERLHSTLQTVRRQATVRVIPQKNGFLIDVAVYKELEDLQQPELATVGMYTKRYDDSLHRPQNAPVAPVVRLGWIPLGRDLSLEQEILAQIHARLYDSTGITRLPPVP